MAEELPSLHIDTDWKKQAQEEKRKLAEALEKQRAEAAARAAAPPAGPAAPMPGAPARAGAPAGRRTGRETPVASFAGLVNSVLTQAMMYLGEIAPQGVEPTVNLDMAKYQVDTLGILEDRTRNNLTPDEQHLLDSALYDLRSRFITVASQYI